MEKTLDEQVYLWLMDRSNPADYWTIRTQFENDWMIHDIILAIRSLVDRGIVAVHSHAGGKTFYEVVG